MSTIDTQVLPAGTWQVDKVHSSIGFAVDYMAGTFHGTFSDFDAVVADGVLNGSAKVASVQVKDENLAAHLQSPEFFDAQAHPELTFTSNAITRDGDQGPHRDRRDHGRDLRSPRRPLRRRALRAGAPDSGRPRRVQHQLEQLAAERRAGPLQRGDDQR